MNCEAMLARCGSVGMAVAVSGISRGKSILAKLSVGMCGNYPKGCLGYMNRQHGQGALEWISPISVR